MSHTPLGDRYNLFAEIWQETPDRPPYFMQVSIPALNLAIKHRIEHVINFVVQFYAHKEDLNQTTPHRKFTPLHIAAITSNVEAAEQLIRAGAEVNCRDSEKWTPLHHAALAGNQVMIDLLLRSGADCMAETSLGATFQNLTELLHPPQSAPRIFWRDAEGVENLLSRDGFHKLTTAHFTSENVACEQQLFSYWNSFPKVALQDELVFANEFKQKYLEQLEMPVHAMSKVWHDSEGAKLISSPGLGLFAKKPFEAKEIIGEYLGVVSQSNGSNVSDLITIDATAHRNEIPIINDGFINCVMIPVHGVRGLPTREIMVAAEPIGKGDQFCWNYGFHPTKMGPYVELRKKEVRKFVKTCNFQEMAHLLTRVGVSGNVRFEDFIKAEKFRYILCTPSLIFLLGLEGVLNDARVKELHTLSYLLQIFPVNTHPELRSIPDVVRISRELINKLQCCFPRLSKAYYQFLLDLPARGGITVTLDFANQAHAAITSKLKHIAKDIDLTERWDEGDVVMLDNMQKNYFDVALKSMK